MVAQRSAAPAVRRRRRAARAVYQAKTDAPHGACATAGVVNDRVHQDLQLDLDRSNSDLRSA